MLPSTERKLECYINSNNIFSYSQHFDIEVNKTKIRVENILTQNEEKIFPSKLNDLILTFKDGVMTIYDALLSDKKILFVGDSNTSCEKLCNYVFSCLDLVPDCLGILKRIHPYKNLYDMDFLKSNNSIYAVTNPIFKNKTDSWDIMCEVDTGKIILNEKYRQQL
jgi:hypothetical protein